MTPSLKEQIDMFEGMLTPEWVHGEKIKTLEEKQNALRKALFKRWKDQDERINELNTSFNKLLEVLDGVSLV